MERINKDIFAESPGRERWTRVFANEHGVLAQDDQDGLWYFHRTQVSDRRTRETHQTREVWSPEPLGKSGEWGHAFAELSEGGVVVVVVVAQKKDGTFWLFEAAWDTSKPPLPQELRVLLLCYRQPS